MVSLNVLVWILWPIERVQTLESTYEFVYRFFFSWRNFKIPILTHSLFQEVHSCVLCWSHLWEMKKELLLCTLSITRMSHGRQIRMMLPQKVWPYFLCLKTLPLFCYIKDDKGCFVSCELLYDIFLGKCEVTVFYNFWIVKYPLANTHNCMIINKKSVLDWKAPDLPLPQDCTVLFPPPHPTAWWCWWCW